MRSLDLDHLSLSTAFLLPLAALYWIGWRGYELIYKLGLKKPKRAHSPVVVVGNLTVGGSGKTPATLWVAKALQELGHEVVISTSGYGSPGSVMATLVPAGELNAHEWGDESAEIRDALPEIPMIVGRNRVRAAELCAHHFPNAVLLLDDGYQHKPLAKDISIVLDPPRGNPFVLPAGPYREPRSNLKHASARIPGDFEMKLTQVSLRSSQGPLITAAEVKDRNVNVVTAVARPERVMGLIEALGANVRGGMHLPDHDPMTNPKLRQTLVSGCPVIVTKKDWMKLRRLPPLADEVWILERVLEIQPRDKFMDWLERELNGIKRN